MPRWPSQDPRGGDDGEGFPDAQVSGLCLGPGGEKERRDPQTGTHPTQQERSPDPSARDQRIGKTMKSETMAQSRESILATTAGRTLPYPQDLHGLVHQFLRGKDEDLVVLPSTLLPQGTNISVPRETRAMSTPSGAPGP